MGTTVRLTRIEREPYGTFGVLVKDNHQPLVTCEPPWIGRDDWGQYPYGKPYLSCVPAGRYTLIYRESPKYGWSWFLQGEGVDLEDRGDRFACLIHTANWPHQLQGCISPGLAKGVVGDKYGIFNSRLAMNQFRSWLDESKDHELVIT